MMINKLINKLVKLIDVKSIVTLGFSAVFAYLALRDRMSEDSFMTVFVMIMTYYFAKSGSSSHSEERYGCPYISEPEISEEETESEV